ncbi:MAG: hypothetical protein ACRDBH_04205 [Bosea sp. (in: a-proteobacteria)]
MRIAPALTVLATLGLAACQSSGPPPAPSPSQAATGVTPNTFRLPTGEGCSGEVERFQAVMDNDLATGHTTKGVHSTVSAEIATARTTCTNGNQAGAISQINGTKSKFGYR